MPERQLRLAWVHDRSGEPNGDLQLSARLTVLINKRTIVLARIVYRLKVHIFLCTLLYRSSQRPDRFTS